MYLLIQEKYQILFFYLMNFQINQMQRNKIKKSQLVSKLAGSIKIAYENEYQSIKKQIINKQMIIQENNNYNNKKNNKQHKMKFLLKYQFQQNYSLSKIYYIFSTLNYFNLKQNKNTYLFVLPLIFYNQIP
ncbi:hypothetical protein ABPG72_011031 [Tetrahymena utriculariae]